MQASAPWPPTLEKSEKSKELNGEHPESPLPPPAYTLVMEDDPRAGSPSMSSSSLPAPAPGPSGFAAHTLPSGSRRQPPPNSLSPPPRLGSMPQSGSLPSSPSFYHSTIPHSRSMVSMDGHRAEIQDDTGRPDQDKSLPRPPTVETTYRRSESFASSPPRQRALSEAPPRRSDSSRPHALLDAPVVNGLHINSPRDPISGSWRLDPSLVPIGAAPKHSKRRPKSNRKAMGDTPQFSLETTDKPISANLAIIGRPGDEARKGVIHITTKAGEVRVDVQEKTVGRFFDLDIYNKEGDTKLFLPQGFMGVVELYFKKGKLELRDALSRDLRTLRTTETETLLLVGKGAMADQHEHADYVRCEVRDGKLILGRTADDDFEVPVLGFWSKMFSKKHSETKSTEKVTLT
ncbi:unnamed protein product [Peniophora sp. CBMAI 1063]|nr:unnamed protein product [Peniophora sp. CBMAI 1063]